jgi:hypothetical protein
MSVRYNDKSYCCFFNRKGAKSAEKDRKVVKNLSPNLLSSSGFAFFAPLRFNDLLDNCVVSYFRNVCRKSRRKFQNLIEKFGASAFYIRQHDHFLSPGKERNQ